MGTAEPLEWSTLDEAAEWMAIQTGEPWIPKRVLDVVVRQTKERVDRSHKASSAAGVPSALWTPSNPYTPLWAAPPANCEFILHPMPGAHPPGTLHVTGPVPWRPLPLRLIEVHQLRIAGELMLKAANGRGDPVNERGLPLYFEELSPPAKVTLANVVLNATALLTMMDAIHTRIEAAPALKPAHTVPALEPAGEWKEHARAEARKFIKQKAASDLFPPQMNVADHVAKHLKVQGIFGSDGKPLSGATIKRHALKGISSAKKKAQSTAPKRGK